MPVDFASFDLDGITHVSSGRGSLTIIGGKRLQPLPRDLLFRPPRGLLYPAQVQSHLYRTAISKVHMQTSLVTGASVWFAFPGKTPAPHADFSRCLCGKHMPSRPHLLWNCPATADLRTRLSLPTDTCQERLLAIPRHELPPPPFVISIEEDIQELAAAILGHLPHDERVMVIGTDGSMDADIAAFAIVLENSDFILAAGIEREDQFPFKAELMALPVTLTALTEVFKHVSPCDFDLEIHIVTDCIAAIDACKGRPCLLYELAASAHAALLQLRQATVVGLHWCPSHGTLGETRLRAINPRADHPMRRRCDSSSRLQWHQLRRRAHHWECQALNLLDQVAARYRDHTRQFAGPP